jgi:hypothetical protein
MYLQYGGYRHVSGEVELSAISKTLLRTPKVGYKFGVKEVWTLKGFLQAPDVPSISAAIAAIEQAYGDDFQTVGLYNDDGSPTAHIMQGANALGGVRVISLSYPQGQGAEYSTFRSYQLVIEGTYQVIAADFLLYFSESLSFMGGGPRFVFRQPINGVPQRQQVAQATPYFARQAGKAVGLLRYPIPPPPIWPFDEHTDKRHVSEKSPTRIGGVGSPVYIEHEVDWDFSFESANPLIAVPTYWPAGGT